MGNLLDTVKGSDVVKCVDAGRQATVKAEDLVVDQGGQGEVVEQVGKVFPDIGVAIFPQALIVKPVDLSNLAGFVVATENGNALGVSDFEGDEQRDGLDGVVTSIDVIACTSVRGLGKRL